MSVLWPRSHAVYAEKGIIHRRVDLLCRDAALLLPAVLAAVCH
jgi:hypothetical protein